MDRLYERLTPTERFQIAVAAFGRGDLAEVDRLNDSTPYRTFKIQEPAYFNRLQRITWLALHVTVQARGQQTAALAAYAAMVLHTMRTEDLAGDADHEDARFGELGELCAERISRLKALTSAWDTFCAGLGLSASDLDKMIGLPLTGSAGALELIEETLGEIALDEDYRKQCLDQMTGFWDRMIRNRHPG
jgi:hypothetical protein